MRSTTQPTLVVRAKTDINSRIERRDTKRDAQRVVRGKTDGFTGVVADLKCDLSQAPKRDGEGSPPSGGGSGEAAGEAGAAGGQNGEQERAPLNERGTVAEVESGGEGEGGQARGGCDGTLTQRADKKGAGRCDCEDCRAGSARQDAKPSIKSDKSDKIVGIVRGDIAKVDSRRKAADKKDGDDVSGTWAGSFWGGDGQKLKIDCAFGPTFEQPNTLSSDPFGLENYNPSFKNITWAATDDKLIFSGTLKISCPWGVNAGDNTDVPSATAPVVTNEDHPSATKDDGSKKKVWEAIRDDLMPDPNPPYKSERDYYWSKALTERHEKFHGTDDWRWTLFTGLPDIIKWLKEQEVTAPDAFMSSSIESALNARIEELLEAAVEKLEDDNYEYYKGGGSSHGSRAGEIRAYQDGKAAYTALAQGVERHGQSLQAAESTK